MLLKEQGQREKALVHISLCPAPPPTWLEACGPFWSLSRGNLCPPRLEHPGTTHNPGISVEFNHNNGNYTTNNMASLCSARKPEVPCRYCAPYRIDRRRGSKSGSRFSAPALEAYVEVERAGSGTCVLGLWTADSW